LDAHEPGLLVRDVRRSHLMDWAVERYPLIKDGQRAYANDTRRGMMMAVQRAFSWAVERDMIPYSPLSKVKKPPPVSRNTCLLPGQWNQVLAYIDQPEFRDFMVALRFTGCRPQEVRRIEARHLFLDHDPPFWTLEPELVKGGREARVTPLVGPMLEMCQRLVALYPEGPLFRNRRGRPWCRSSLHSACYRLQERLRKAGVTVRVTAYTMRHTFRNHAAVHGAQDASVATVMGHKGTQMGKTAYNHLALYKDHLLATMQQATAGEAS
jgi:integrase